MIMNYVSVDFIAWFLPISYIFICKYIIMAKMTLTSVKLPDELWDEFRISCVKHKFSLQKLTERSMFLYLTDEEFRKNIHNQLNTQLTGSI